MSAYFSAKNTLYNFSPKTVAVIGVDSSVREIESSGHIHKVAVAKQSIDLDLRFVVHESTLHLPESYNPRMSVIVSADCVPDLMKSGHSGEIFTFETIGCQECLVCRSKHDCPALKLTYESVNGHDQESVQIHSKLPTNIFAQFMADLSAALEKEKVTLFYPLTAHTMADGTSSVVVYARRSQESVANDFYEAETIVRHEMTRCLHKYT